MIEAKEHKVTTNKIPHWDISLEDFKKGQAYRTPEKVVLVAIGQEATGQAYFDTV